MRRDGELAQHVGAESDPLPRPDEIRFSDALPRPQRAKSLRASQGLALAKKVSGDTAPWKTAVVLVPCGC